ncbi:MAG: lipopolysaccharide heptosyltransferase II [Planctomycetes bacterium]|nr:lipopolysaccharide heptosyltransferase II [Planctomycetota bacterium]
MEFSRILIRCPNWVGDLVMATPVLKAMRDRFPEAHVTLALRPYLQKVLRGFPGIDAWLPLPRARGFMGMLQAIRAHAHGKHDLALLLPNSWESAIAPFFAGIPHRVGYARDGRSFLLSRRLRVPMHGGKRIPRPMVWHYADLAGLCDAVVRDPRPRLFHEIEDEVAWERRRGAFGLEPERPYALLNPGASFGSSKVWTPEGFAAVAEELEAAHGLAVFVVVGPGEEELAAAIVARARTRVRAVVDPILDLHELKAAVAGARLLVTTDTGTRQYGTAYGIPTVVLFGPTDERYTANALTRTALVRHALPCAPCHRKTCPLEHQRCMRALDAHDVLRGVDLVLSGS